MNFKMEYFFIKQKSKAAAQKLNISWEKLIVSDFDEGVEILSAAVIEINEIVDYALKNKLSINLNSSKLSKHLKSINHNLENHQYVEVADIVKYKLIDIVRSI